MVINGVELNFDLYDISTMEVYDKGIASMQELNNKLGQDTDMDPHEKLRCLMTAMRAFFDGLFGIGTGVSICGESNLRTHMEAYKAIIQEANRQKKEYGDLCNSFSVDNPNLHLEPVRNPEAGSVQDILRSLSNDESAH